MEKLLKGTTAYKIFVGDRDKNCLSHAYMLYFSDKYNLKNALKIFALTFFDEDKNSIDGKRIWDETFTDLKVYPAPDKKLSVADATDIVDDCALRPVERDKKLFIISDFDTAAPLFQNKLLKILEEPPKGVYFILGTTTMATVLDTVRSRVKLLEIPPFSESQVYEALCRIADNPLNKSAAASSLGILGRAQNMLAAGWYEEVHKGALELCSAKTFFDAAQLSIKYGDTKYKNELLAEMQKIYFDELQKALSSKDSKGAIYYKPTLIYALESIVKAYEDVNFNANFQALLYNFAVRVIEENDKWKKLLA
jgi:DNA polymerase-3 subunit delta'